MKVRVSVLADYASMSEGNKLNILGIFTNIASQNVPIVFPQMKLVVQYEFDSSEAGKKNVKIEMVDADGQEMFSVNVEIMVPRSLNNEMPPLSQILNLNNMMFPKFGDYEFKILVNDRIESTIPLKVIEIKKTEVSNPDLSDE